MVTTVVRGPETRAQKRKRVRDAKLGEAIPGLLDDIVITHVLRSEHFDDPADLARLPAVSRAMRDAVAAKVGRLVLVITREQEARMFKRGAAPATGRSPVASRTPLSGSGEERTARRVEVVARERLPVGRVDMRVCGGWRSPRDVEMGA